MAHNNRRKNKRNKGTAKEQKPMLFDKKNYMFMAIGVLLVLVGFTGMYIEREMDGFFSLYITPLMVIGGFATVVYSVLVSDKNETETVESVQE